MDEPKAVRAGRTAIEPVYTTEDAAGVPRLMRPCSYAERIKVAEGVENRFTDVESPARLRPVWSCG
ncbi:MAG: hypothetical protein ACLU3I_20775 [Acutalibacteraceae bacterium]